MPRSTSKRITRDQWLSTALNMFARTGEGGLHVEKLAREVGVAKSGFYWHFKDREELMQDLFAYWSYEYTEIVTENALLLMSPPRQRLLMIMTVVFDQNLTEFDAAMHVWSNKDPKVAKKLRNVLKMRVSFVRQPFVELGFKGNELEIRTRAFLSYINSERQVFGPGQQTSLKLREPFLDLLVAGTGIN